MRVCVYIYFLKRIFVFTSKIFISILASKLNLLTHQDNKYRFSCISLYFLFSPSYFSLFLFSREFNLLPSFLVCACCGKIWRPHLAAYRHLQSLSLDPFDFSFNSPSFLPTLVVSRCFYVPFFQLVSLFSVLLFIFRFSCELPLYKADKIGIRYREILLSGANRGHSTVWPISNYSPFGWLYACLSTAAGQWRNSIGIHIELRQRNSWHSALSYRLSIALDVAALFDSCTYRYCCCLEHVSTSMRFEEIEILVTMFYDSSFKKLCS